MGWKWLRLQVMTAKPRTMAVAAMRQSRVPKRLTAAGQDWYSASISAVYAA